MWSRNDGGGGGCAAIVVAAQQWRRSDGAQRWGAAMAEKVAAQRWRWRRSDGFGGAATAMAMAAQRWGWQRSNGALAAQRRQWRWRRSDGGGSAAMAAQRWGAAMGRSDGREGGGAAMAMAAQRWGWQWWRRRRMSIALLSLRVAAVCCSDRRPPLFATDVRDVFCIFLLSLHIFNVGTPYTQTHRHTDRRTDDSLIISA